MTEAVVYTNLCEIGTRLQITITRDAAETSRTTVLLIEAEETRYSEIPHYREQLAGIKRKLDSGRVELARHVGHCNDGCTRVAGQFNGERATSWGRAPSHGKPPLPGAATLAELIRDGATLESLEEIFERSASTIRQRIADAGWSPATGKPLAPAPTQLHALGRQLLDEQPWRLDAICAQTDPEAFYPEKGGSVREAKSVCARCTVAAECLDWALANQERHGIWGGLSERERRRIKPQDQQVPA